MIPDWALRSAGPGDRAEVSGARKKNQLVTNWHDVPGLRKWARSKRWRTAWLTFQSAFFDKMLENDDNFAMVLAETNLTLRIPIEAYTLDPKQISEFDALYESGYFRLLVDELREVRRAVEAGVTVYAGDVKMTSFQSFYSWAHGRYYALEDDTNSSWIGDDSRHPF